MPVIIYCNGKYYLQIIAKKSWRYIIFAKKGIDFRVSCKLDFPAEDEKIAGENVASFNEFIDAIIVFVEQNGGTLEDAIIMANDTYYQL